MSDAPVHFGGPDRPIGLLRDLLEQRVARVPTGGSIDWATFYFRDRRLAAALVEARERGVDVRVTLDAIPSWHCCSIWSAVPGFTSPLPISVDPLR